MTVYCPLSSYEHPFGNQGASPPTWSCIISSFMIQSHTFCHMKWKPFVPAVWFFEICVESLLFAVPYLIMISSVLWKLNHTLFFVCLGVSPLSRIITNFISLMIGTD